MHKKKSSVQKPNSYLSYFLNETKKYVLQESGLLKNDDGDDAFSFRFFFAYPFLLFLVKEYIYFENIKVFKIQFLYIFIFLVDIHA